MIRSIAVAVVVAGSIACGAPPPAPRDPEPRAPELPALRPAPPKPVLEWTVAECPEVVFAARGGASRSVCRWTEEEPRTLEIWLSADAHLRSGAWPDRVRLFIHGTGDAIRVAVGERHCVWGFGESPEKRRACAPQLEMIGLGPGPNDYGKEWEVMVSGRDLTSAIIETRNFIYW